MPSILLSDGSRHPAAPVGLQPGGLRPVGFSCFRDPGGGACSVTPEGLSPKVFVHRIEEGTLWKEAVGIVSTEQEGRGIILGPLTLPRKLFLGRLSLPMKPQMGKGVIRLYQGAFAVSEKAIPIELVNRGGFLVY
jgi:hypothetical protein